MPHQIDYDNDYDNDNDNEAAQLGQRAESFIKTPGLRRFGSFRSGQPPFPG